MHVIKDEHSRWISILLASTSTAPPPFRSLLRRREFRRYFSEIGFHLQWRLRTLFQHLEHAATISRGNLKPVTLLLLSERDEQRRKTIYVFPKNPLFHTFRTTFSFLEMSQFNSPQFSRPCRKRERCWLELDSIETPTAKRLEMSFSDIDNGHLRCGANGMVSALSFRKKCFRGM